MKTYFFSLLLVLACNLAIAQSPMASLKKVVSFTFVQEDGTNASAVAWNPSARLYYAVIAGNAGFPLETFDEQGQPVTDRAARADMRGIWWNPKKRVLMGNCAGEEGWVEIAADLQGTLLGAPEVVMPGMHQPDFQSVGAFDGKNVVFYHEGSLHVYNAKNGKAAKTITLRLPASLDDINFTTAGCTGIKNYEYVLLDYASNRLYFFNRKGNHTGTSKLPADAVTHDVFRFSFANGIAFLYDAEERTWTGYKVF